MSSVNLKISDRSINFDVTGSKVMARCGYSEPPKPVMDRIREKVADIRTRFGGVYLDYYIKASDVNLKAYGGSDVHYLDECHNDYILHLIGQNHPFVTMNSVGYDADQTMDVLGDGLQTTVAGTAHPNSAVRNQHAGSKTMVGLRHYIISGKLGRTKATKKITDWSKNVVARVLCGYDRYEYYMPGYTEEALMADVPMYLLWGMDSHSRKYLWERELETINLIHNTEAQEDNASYRVRLSFDPDDPMTFGHWYFDSNACFAVKRQSSTATPVIAQDKNAVSIFVYDTNNKPIGRAWGRVLFDGDTRNISSLIITNVYPNTNGKQQATVKSIISSVCSALGLRKSTTQPELGVMNPVGGWIYFNKDAEIYLAKDSSDSKLWVIDNQDLPRRWCHKLDEEPTEERYSKDSWLPLWSGGVVDASDKDAMCIQASYYELIQNLSSVVRWRSDRNNLELLTVTHCADMQKRGMYKPDSDQANYIELDLTPEQRDVVHKALKYSPYKTTVTKSYSICCPEQHIKETMEYINNELSKQEINVDSVVEDSLAATV